MSKSITYYVYVKYGHDEIGEYTEKVYFLNLIPETDDLEYIGQISSSKVNLNEDTRTYI